MTGLEQRCEVLAELVRDLEGSKYDAAKEIERRIKLEVQELLKGVKRVTDHKLWRTRWGSPPPSSVP